LDTSYFSETNFAIPEHALWLAVIERAMMDYLGRYASISKPNKGSLFAFFFDLKPRPHNLQYICENLFDYPDAAKVIRKRIKDLAENITEEDIKTIGTERYVSKLKLKI